MPYVYALSTHTVCACSINPYRMCMLYQPMPNVYALSAHTVCALFGSTTENQYTFRFVFIIHTMLGQSRLYTDTGPAVIQRS